MKQARRHTINLMEVCGTHTMAIARHGLRSLFPSNVSMLTGPGCPICVTETVDIDRAIMVGREKKVILATFGDMLHVPGSFSSLERERSAGTDVRVVYSPVDALTIAQENPSAEVVFIGVGFETTAPVVAATVLIAKKKKISNFSVLPLFKTVPLALRALLSQGMKAGVPAIHGFMLPGHVSAIIGTAPYRFISDEFGIPGVIAGFEPEDIKEAVRMLVEMVENKRPAIKIQYTSTVPAGGNPTARDLLSKVFVQVDARWRSIGVIPGSGLTFGAPFADYNAALRFAVTVPPSKEPKGCQCGNILLGRKQPRQCALFGANCSPAHPVGPCMVSSEGACAAEYKYGRSRR